MSELRYDLRLLSDGMHVARVARLDGVWRKGRGVIGMGVIPAGTGVWLTGVGAIHTCFVTGALDIVFLDGDMRTLAVYSSVPPWRLWVAARGAQHTLELGAGTLARLTDVIKVGDFWELLPESFH